MGSRTDQRDQTETASKAESEFPGPTEDRVSGISVRRSDVVPRGPEVSQDEGIDDIEVIAHELGNKIGVIENALSLLKRQLPAEVQKDENVSEILRIITEEQSDMSHIIKRVRTSAQDALSSPALPEEVPEHVVIDLSETLEAEVKLWRRILRMKIAITRNFQQGIKIRGDHVELHELIHNVFKNAVQIMQQQPEEERKLHVRIRQKEGIIQVFVHDNGPGIKDEDRKELFHKGFTKKKGKGIGLYYSQKLARKMGGDIVIMNNKDLLDVESQDEIPPEDLVLSPHQTAELAVPAKNDPLTGDAKIPGFFKEKINGVIQLFFPHRPKQDPSEIRRPRKIRLADFKGAVAIIEFPVLEKELNKNFVDRAV